MLNQNEPIFTIPIFSIWYVIITLILILMRVTNIVDWSPLVLLLPIWFPIVFVIFIIIVLYTLKTIIYFTK